MLVTIIVPGFNIENYVRRCLESISNQSYKNLEIVLVNDGSTDETGKIFDDYAKKDERIRVLHKSNGGVSSARNLGLQQATGDYVLFVDGDDWLEKNAIEMLVDVVKLYDNDVVLFEYCVDYVDGKKNVCLHPELHGSMTVQQAIENTIAPINRFVWSKLYKRSILRGVYFDETIHLGEDTLFACEAMINGESAYFIAKPLYHYVQSANSATRKKYFDKRMLTGKDAYYKLVRICRKYYPKSEDIAIRNYIEILMTIIMDMYKEPKRNRSWIRQYTNEIRKYLLKLIGMTKDSNSTKIKAILCSVNPGLMVKVRTYSQKNGKVKN